MHLERGMGKGLLEILLILFFMLSGCSPPKPVSSSNVQDDIEVQIWASSNCARVGDTVRLRATATNLGTHTKMIELKDKPVLDIVFGNPATGTRWSEGKPLTGDLRRLELEPGKSKIIETDWVVDRTQYGSVGVWAILLDSDQFKGLAPGVTVNVDNCPGFLGP